MRIPFLNIYIYHRKEYCFLNIYVRKQCLFSMLTIFLNICLRYRHWWSQCFWAFVSNSHNVSEHLSSLPLLMVTMFLSICLRYRHQCSQCFWIFIFNGNTIRQCLNFIFIFNENTVSEYLKTLFLVFSTHIISEHLCISSALTLFLNIYVWEQHF